MYHLRKLKSLLLLLLVAVTAKAQISNGKVYNIEFIGGCNGNLKGIGAICEGMSIDEIIDKLSGIKCGFKSTSCPDQLARALAEAKNKAGD